MPRRGQNPWDGVRPGFESELGRVTIHVALKAGAPAHHEFSERDLLNLVGRLTSGSVVAQVGITRGWGEERSAQVIIVNAGSWVRRWPEFEAHTRAVAQKLCRALEQEAVLVEFESRKHGYHAETWSDIRMRGRKRRAKARVTGRVPRTQNPRLSTQPVIEAFARYIGSLNYNAPIRSQQRLYEAYSKKLETLLRRAGRRSLSEEEQTKLQLQAEDWWNARAMKGAGVDW